MELERRKAWRGRVEAQDPDRVLPTTTDILDVPPMRRKQGGEYMEGSACLGELDDQRALLGLLRPLG